MTLYTKYSAQQCEAMLINVQQPKQQPKKQPKQQLKQQLSPLAPKLWKTTQKIINDIFSHCVDDLPITKCVI